VKLPTFYNSYLHQCKRYSYLVLVVIGSVLFSIKYTQEFAENCSLKCEYLSLSLWVLFLIKILHLALYQGGIRGEKTNLTANKTKGQPVVQPIFTYSHKYRRMQTV
jgi:hypothetical protein